MIRRSRLRTTLGSSVVFILGVCRVVALAQTPSTSVPAGKSNTVAPTASVPKPAAKGASPIAGATGKAAPAVTMQLRKEIPGEFTYQFVSRTGEPSAPNTLPTSAGAEVIALVVPAEMKPSETVLQILDNGRGNAARLPVTTSGVVSLTEGSFKYVQIVSVPIQAQGKGVYGVQVSLTGADKKISQTLLLQPGDNGVATFRNVPLGTPVTVTVRYAAHPPEMQTKTLTQDHPADGFHWPAINLDWKDAKTVAAPASTTIGNAPQGGSERDGETRPAPTAPQTSPFGNIISTVISWLVLAGIAYGLYWAYSNGRIKPFLDKLGIQTEPMAATGGKADNPFAKPERTPIQPITEGTADPFAGAPATNGVAGYASPNSGPRLVGTMGSYAGSIFPLNGGNLEIGRDPGNAVPLPQDTNASRRHATIQSLNGEYRVIDNDSSNGTYVNGVRIAAQTPQTLRPGDEVQIGQTRFRFEA